MDAILLLAESAHVSNGLLYVWGAGWSVITGPHVSFAVAIRLGIPWASSDEEHNWTVALEDADGQPVTMPGHNHPVAYRGQFHAHRGERMPDGVPIDHALVIPLRQLVLAQGRYTCRLTIDDETREHWSAAFTVQSK